AEQLDDAVMSDAGALFDRGRLPAAPGREIFDGLHEFGYAFVLRSDGADDRRLPTVLLTRSFRHFKKRDQLSFGSLDALAVGFVDDKDVADLHDACFDRLNVIAHSRHEPDD